MFPSPFIQHTLLNAFDYMMPQIIQPSNPLETTSFDGRPFLNPFQLISTPFSQLRYLPRPTPQKILKVHKVQTVFKNQVQENLGKRNLETFLEENTKVFSMETQDFENAKKKIFVSKTTKHETNDEISTICMDSPNKSESSTDEQQAITKTTPVSNIIEATRKAQMKEKKVIVLDEERKLKNILQTAYNHKTGRLSFKVESESESGKNENILLNREDILQEDPMLLVYYYEKCLKFHKTTGFSSDDLQKI